MVQLDSLVPADHLLRKIDRFIDFEFIRDKVTHLYCADNGRPAKRYEALYAAQGGSFKCLLTVQNRYYLVVSVKLAPSKLAGVASSTSFDSFSCSFRQ